tara:strand:+ start:15463 stop:16506 length:1044 start_codon:yes stop_codon:yes gene_type:complete
MIVILPRTIIILFLVLFTQFISLAVNGIFDLIPIFRIASWLVFIFLMVEIYKLSMRSQSNIFLLFLKYQIWYVILAVFFSYLISSSSVVDGDWPNIRLGGDVFHPNRLAIIFSMIIIFSFFNTRGAIRPLLFVIGLMGLFATGSRTGLIATIIAFLAVYLFNKPKLLFVVLIVLVFPFFLIFTQTNFVEIFLFRGLGPEDFFSASGRLAIWLSSLDLWIQNPIFGCGYITCTKEELPSMVSDSLGFEFEAATHAHNDILQQLASTGLVGTMPLLFFYANLIKNIFDYSKLSINKMSHRNLLICLSAMLLIMSLGEQSLSSTLGISGSILVCLSLIFDFEKSTRLYKR